MEGSLPNHYFCLVGRLGFHGDSFGMDCTSVSAIFTEGSCFVTFCKFSREKRHINFKDCGPMTVGSYMACSEHNIIMCFVNKILKTCNLPVQYKGVQFVLHSKHIPLRLCV